LLGVSAAATLWLTNGVLFIHVAKWLGHSSYVLTLTTYADYIPDVETENPLPEPVVAQPKTKVVNLFWVAAGLTLRHSRTRHRENGARDQRAACQRP
jgi:hypothetical protein